MKSYFIFAIFLTTAYIIYYIVIIAQELYGKKKNGKPEEEVFDIDSGEEEEEESISVTESDTGFNVGSEQYETEYGGSAAGRNCCHETCTHEGKSRGTHGRNGTIPVGSLFS